MTHFSKQTPGTVRGAGIRVVAAAALWVVSIGAVRAGEGDLCTINAGYNRVYDDNVYLLHDASSTDFIDEPWAEIKLDKSWGLQRVTLDGTVTHYKYHDFTALSYVGDTYKAQWQWAVTPDFTGVALVTGNKQQQSFSSYQSTTTGNVVTTRTDVLAGDWKVGGGLHVTASGYGGVATNSVVAAQSASSRYSGGTAGLTYLTSLGTSFSVREDLSYGKYTDQTTVDSLLLKDYRYDGRQTDFVVSWPIDGLSKLDATVSRVSRSHPDMSIRDYSGNAGSLAYTWTPTGKLDIVASATRAISEWEDSVASYITQDTLALNATWAATSAVSVQGGVSVGRAQFGGTQLPINLAGLPFRRDLTHTYQLGASWKPNDKLTLTCNVQASNRDSTPGIDWGNNGFSDRTVSIGAQLSF